MLCPAWFHTPPVDNPKAIDALKYMLLAKILLSRWVWQYAVPAEFHTLHVDNPKAIDALKYMLLAKILLSRWVWQNNVPAEFHTSPVDNPKAIDALKYMLLAKIFLSRWIWQYAVPSLISYTPCGIFLLKMSGARFFSAPIRLNPTTNTLILDHSARFLFFSPDCKISWWNFARPTLTWRQPFEAPIYPTSTGPDRTGVRTWFYVRVCFLICHHFFYSLMYVYHFTTIRIYPWTVKNTRTEKILPNSRPDPFLGSWTRPPPKFSKIWPHYPNFWGVARSGLGDPWWSRAPCLSLNLTQEESEWELLRLLMG